MRDTIKVKIEPVADGQRCKAAMAIDNIKVDPYFIGTIILVNRGGEFETTEKQLAELEGLGIEYTITGREESRQ